jgi:hypothetical protein
MSYTKLEIIKTRDNSFKHIPNGNEAMAFYISKGHYTMENGFLTLTEKGKPSRPKVAWFNVTYRDGINGKLETFASFDDLDTKLVAVEYPLARSSSNANQNLQKVLKNGNSYYTTANEADNIYTAKNYNDLEKKESKNIQDFNSSKLTQYTTLDSENDIYLESNMSLSSGFYSFKSIFNKLNTNLLVNIRKATLNYFDGLFLKTALNDSPFGAFLKSDGITNSDKTLQLPDSDGVLTVSINGNYADTSGNITLPPGGEPQVNADWNAVTGVSEILNKPDFLPYDKVFTLQEVVNAGSSINNQTIYSYNNDNTKGTEIYSGEFGLQNFIDNKHLSLYPDRIRFGTNLYQEDGSGANYLTGNAASGVNNEFLLPNKPGGTYELATKDDILSLGGGVTPQVNADWNATSGPGLILNKPINNTIKIVGKLSLGYNNKALEIYENNTGEIPVVAWEGEGASSYVKLSFVNFTAMSYNKFVISKMANDFINVGFGSIWDVNNQVHPTGVYFKVHNLTSNYELEESTPFPVSLFFEIRFY